MKIKDPVMSVPGGISHIGPRSKYGPILDRAETLNPGEFLPVEFSNVAQARLANTSIRSASKTRKMDLIILLRGSTIYIGKKMKEQKARSSKKSALKAAKEIRVPRKR